MARSRWSRARRSFNISSSKHGWTDLYPASLSDRARVDAFCHWHHGGTRQLAGGFYAPHVRPDMAEKFGEDGIARAKKNGLDALNTLETTWLAADPFLAGANATLADLIAYEEVAQLAPKFGNVLTYAEYPKVAAWLERMAALPYHDEVSRRAQGARRPGRAERAADDEAARRGDEGGHGGDRRRECCQREAVI